MYFVGSISKVPQRGSFQKGLLDLRRSTVLSFVPQGFSTASLVQRLHRITGRSISRCFKTQKKCWQGRSLRACISCCCQFGCVLAVKNWSYTLYCLLEDFCSEITLRCGPEKFVILTIGVEWIWPTLYVASIHDHLSIMCNLLWFMF